MNIIIVNMNEVACYVGGERVTLVWGGYLDMANQVKIFPDTQAMIRTSAGSFEICEVPLALKHLPRGPDQYYLDVIINTVQTQHHRDKKEHRFCTPIRLKFNNKSDYKLAFDAELGVFPSTIRVRNRRRLNDSEYTPPPVLRSLGEFYTSSNYLIRDF